MRLKLLLFGVIAFVGTGSLRAQWEMTSGWNNFVNTPAPVSFAVDGDTIIASGHDSHNYPEMSGLLFSTDLGSNWKRIAQSFYGQSVTILAAGGPCLLVKVEDSTHYNFSSNFGLQWVRSTFDGIDTITNYPNSLILSDSQIIWYSDAIYPNLYRSDDHGQTWKTIKTAGLPNLPYNGGICLLSGHRLIMPILDSTAYNPVTGRSKNFTHFYISTDNGSNWTRQPGSFAGNGYADLVEADHFLFIGSDSGVFRSSDNGADWTSTRLLRPPASLLAVGNALLASVGNYFVYRTEGGARFSTDLGDHWLDGNWGFDSSNYYEDLESVQFAVCGNTLLASPSSEPGTFNTGGIWRRPLSDFGITSAVQEKPQSTERLRIYPNPATKSATISVTSPETGYADISILNLLGIEVAYIFSGELAAGDHAFHLEPTGLPDGIYECVVRMNGSVQTVPLTVQH